MIADPEVERRALALNPDVHARVDALERELLGHPQTDMPPVHHFAPGIYGREITIPAGTILTGKIHRTAHLNIISKGSISVWTENEGIRRITAPCTFVAQPGTRRVGFAHEETVWTTVHATEETDLERLEAQLIVKHDALTASQPGELA